jgi:hypothetical protein
VRVLAGSRAAAVGGVLFAVLYVASLFGVLDIPDGSDSDAVVRAAFVDDRAGIVIGVYLLGAAGFFFLWFLRGLHARLREQATEHALAGVVLAGGDRDMTFNLGDEFPNWCSTSAWIVHTTVGSAFDNWSASVVSRVGEDEPHY